jgi:hypothetical protein
LCVCFCQWKIENISLMNSGIIYFLSRGFATRENTNSGAHSVKYTVFLSCTGKNKYPLYSVYVLSTCNRKPVYILITQHKYAVWSGSTWATSVYPDHPGHPCCLILNYIDLFVFFVKNKILHLKANSVDPDQTAWL